MNALITGGAGFIGSDLARLRDTIGFHPDTPIEQIIRNGVVSIETAGGS